LEVLGRLAILVVFVGVVSGCSTSAVTEPGADRPSVVVTTEVLGGVVADLVGDAAMVSVLMSGGADPHSWQPSARQTESIFAADLVVTNGLALEEGLVDVLERASADGVAVFEATDHVQEHGADDPHFWLDPLAMRDAVLALGPELLAAGIDVGGRDVEVAAGLEALDARLADVLAVVPDDRRKLVTGHDSLGYLADRYGFAVVGAVMPGRSTSSEPSARDLADLIAAVRAEDVTAVFTEVGTPRSVARSLADDAGAVTVELEIAKLPPGGAYQDLLVELATAVAGTLVRD
jgi:zinc/manganese transport system substrate-binding protein